jgi:Gpi18-like mannosyltransferase
VAQRTGLAVRRVLTPPRLVLAGVVVAALVLRWSLFSIESGDYRAFVDPWYRHLAENGGFAALGDTFSNYNTPYLVLLAAATYLPVPELVAIKSISVIFDLVLAVFTYKIIRRLRPESRWQPVIGTGLVLALPTVVMNSSAWGQCDSIYVSLCLGSLYFLITSGHATTGRPWLASALFGLAFAFKLQTIFFLPVLVVVLIINRQRIRSLLAAPVAFGLALVPAMLAGRGLLSQLSVYPAQISSGSGAPGGGGLAGGGNARLGPGHGFGPGGGLPGGGRGGFSLTDGYSFTFNAPTPYAWLPANASPPWMYLGLGVAAAVTLGFGVWLLARRRRLTAGEVIMVAAAATLLIPLLLPQMHERYFYLAEVLMVVAIFVDRRFAVAAVGIQAASISTYLAYLENARNLPLGLTAVIALGAGVAAVVVVVLRLRTPVAPGNQDLEALQRQPSIRPAGSSVVEPKISSGNAVRGVRSVFRRGRLLTDVRFASW